MDLEIMIKYHVYDSYGKPVWGGVFHSYRDAFCFKQYYGNNQWTIKEKRL